MNKVIPFKKGQLPSEEQNFEKQFEARQRLHPHTEAGGIVPTGETHHVLEASTGDQVELDMTRKMSAFEIYSKMKRNLDQKAAAKMGEEMGVGVESTDPVFKDEFDRLLHQLAEDIYDALAKSQRSIEVIKPESIGAKTIERLGEKGDANFVVAPGQGEHLYESLKDQEVDFRTIRSNDYGFVLENEATDFRVVFIYAERLSANGEPTSLEAVQDDTTPKEDADQDDTVAIQNQKAANQSNLGQGGSLAA